MNALNANSHAVSTIAASVHATIPASDITEAMAIATVLHDIGGGTPSATAVASMSGAMTNAMVEVGYMALANPNMTATEVSNEIVQLSINGANTTWGNQAAQVITTAQATTQLAHYGDTITFPANMNAEAVNNINLEVIGHSSSAAVDSMSGAMTQGMLNIGLASIVDPFMPAGEAGHQVVETTLTGDITDWAAQPMVQLIGLQTTTGAEFHLYQ